MATEPGPAGLEDLARQLEASGDYRVLRRFAPARRYAEPDAAPHRTAVALDIETTGLDPRTDAIIQLSVVAFEYSAETARIHEVREPLTFFEDPGRPIPAEIVKLTGITDADVAGKRIDDPAVEAVARGCGIVLAHNAAFDRPFLERRLPVFRDLPWGCSVADVPWRSLGYASSAQESLLVEHCGVLVHLLATPFESGDLPLRLLLQAARKKSVRLWAVGAAFDAKDALKARRYRWNNGDDKRPKAWYRDVREDEQAVEEKWLSDQIYGGAVGKWKVEVFDARTRYSDRS